MYTKKMYDVGDVNAIFNFSISNHSFGTSRLKNIFKIATYRLLSLRCDAEKKIYLYDTNKN